MGERDDQNPSSLLVQERQNHDPLCLLAEVTQDPLSLLWRRGIQFDSSLPGGKRAAVRAERRNPEARAEWPFEPRRCRRAAGEERGEARAE
jgi:hypothetical protein